MDYLNKNPWLLFILMLLLACLPLFGHLDELPVAMWDEARNATNAYEMSRTGNWLVTTYDYKPDMWNTKPPLLIWIQVLFLKISGTTLLAIRLPSALAALATCTMIYWFLVKKYQNAVWGFLSCFVLITAEGYVRRHGTRTGDYDSLLCFFSTAFVLSWFLYIEEGKRSYFYITLTAIVLAVLTKGVQPLIFLPALLVYCIIRRKLIPFLKSPHFYIGVIVFIIFVSGFYLLRDHYNPGYIKAVVANELGGRYMQALEKHEGSFWYYHNFLSTADFQPWYYLIFIGMAFGLLSSDMQLKRLSIYLSICSIVYLLVLSFAATKLFWYEIPALPLLSILVATCLYKLLEAINNSKSEKGTKILLLLMLAFLALKPYTNICGLTIGGGESKFLDDNHTMAEFLHEALKRQSNISGYQVVTNNPEPNVDWYIKLLEDKGSIKTRPVKALELNRPTVVHQEDQQKIFEEIYEYIILAERPGLKIYIPKVHKGSQ